MDGALRDVTDAAVLREATGASATVAGEWARMCENEMRCANGPLNGHSATEPAESVLRALEGKRISFLGDSLVRQQFEFLVCRLRAHALLEDAVEHRRWHCPGWPHPIRARTSHSKNLSCDDTFTQVKFKHGVVLQNQWINGMHPNACLLYTSPSPRDS